MDINARLKKMTQQRGWSEYRLAKECGLSESTIANIFRKNCTPSFPTLEIICGAFGVSLSQFFAEGNMMTLTPEEQKLVEKMGPADTGTKRRVFKDDGTVYNKNRLIWNGFIPLYSRRNRALKGKYAPAASVPAFRRKFHSEVPDVFSRPVQMRAEWRPQLLQPRIADALLWEGRFLSKRRRHIPDFQRYTPMPAALFDIPGDKAGSQDCTVVPVPFGCRSCSFPWIFPHQYFAYWRGMNPCLQQKTSAINFDKNRHIPY